MRIRRRNLRKALIALGCVVADVRWTGAAVGGGLLLSGALLHLWSKGCLEQNRRLTTAGPYRWTRNPFYLANAAIDLGLCFVIGQLWLAVVFAPIWWLSYHQTIAREEDRLAALFPDSFARYREAVPRLLPTGRRWPRSEAVGQFSWRNPGLARGAEYARLVGIALGPWVIWAAGRMRQDPRGLLQAEHATALGMIVLLPAAWAVKLALAELGRRPETELRPWASRPARRGAVTLALVALVLAVSGRGEAEVTLSALLLGLAFASALTAASAAPRSRVAIGLAVALHAALVLGLFAFGVVGEVLWIASLPISWCAISALDELGALRVSRVGRDEAPQWRYFPAIASGAVALLAMLAALQQFV